MISLNIWQKAKAEQALTSTGEALGAEIARLTAANKQMGTATYRCLASKNICRWE
ncbi:hypothetical protein P4S72_04015 [Vibrio sp. PP-XX7]